MKIRVKNLFLLPMLITGLGLVPDGRLTAQSFTTLHSFDGNDGVYPRGDLVLSGRTLYGTARAGGSFGAGTVFSVNTEGTSFTNLHSFTATSGAMGTNSDGSNPVGGLVLSGHTLYGTAPNGGHSGYGTVFKINTDGTGFTTLYSFDYFTYEIFGLVLSSNILYGTTDLGGSWGYGSVFALNTDGTGFKILHNFPEFCFFCPPSTNAEGGYPLAPLILSERTLYGTTGGGGDWDHGTVFRVNTDGTGFTNLHNFSRDGASDPNAGLTLSGDVLYGAALVGGGSNNGAIFSTQTDGTDFKALHDFTGGSDGGWPGAAPFVQVNTLYGTTTYGGASGEGTAFKANTDGTGFNNLYHFTLTSGPYGTNSDGAGPRSKLILSEKTLYGTAAYGGMSGAGTVFSLSFRPQLTIIPYGAYVILTWPTNNAGFDYTGFILQSATNLVSPVWSTVSPGPVIIGEEKAVFNPISGTQRFYRLSE